MRRHHDASMDSDSIAMEPLDIESLDIESAGLESVDHSETGDRKRPAIEQFFQACCRLGASDLHLKSGSPPCFRLGGEIRRADCKSLSNEQIERIILEVVTETQRKQFVEDGALDFAYQVPGKDRFRINAFRQRSLISVAARRVTKEIPGFTDLLLPPILEKVAQFREGLVLLAGITGSGKSTTIAAMINHINATRACHIVTIEDPIEYVFEDNRAFINQREIGVDVKDFQAALKYLMREDPDVVLLGELRDRETFEAAMHAAETGHLVFGTIHASTASQTITRILDLFPQEGRAHIRQSLAFSLQSIICQKLLPSIHPERSRVPCCEIMLANPAIRKLIAEGRDADILTVLKSSTAESMQDFTEAIHQLVTKEHLDVKTALAVAPNPEELKMRLKGIRSPSPGILA